MIPIFFPYTYLSPPVLNILSSCFGKTAIYQPLDKMIPPELEESIRSGKLEIRKPLLDNDDKLRVILKEYHSWTDFHRMPQRGYHKIIQSLKYSSPDPTSSQIRNEIKDRISQEEKLDGLTASDNARLFLALAQEYDMQQTGLSMEMKQLQDMQQQLFQDLKGDGLNGTDTFTSRFSDPLDFNSDDYMTSERLLAWSHLMCHDTNPPWVFITTDSEAFQMVSEQADTILTLSGFDRRPMDITNKEEPGKGYPAFSDYLDQLTKAEEEKLPAQLFEDMDSSALTREGVDRLNLSMAPNQSPVKLFGKLLHPPIEDTSHTDTDPLSRNTVLALMELSVVV